MSKVRWWVLGLLFFATTINYLDRIVFSVLIPVIRQDLHIDDQMYGYLTSSFTLAYTVGFLIAGGLIDRYGTRIGYAVSVTLWSIAAALHAAAGSAFSLAVWRGVLGFAEAGNFPAAIKATAEWFPKRDRAFATGLFNSGTNIASVVGPPLFVWMTAMYGWRGCFIITASIGFVWLVWWMWFYKSPASHGSVSKAEYDYIHSDEAEADTGGGAALGWQEVIRYRQTWGFAIGKFLTDPVWWFYLFWLPPYLFDVRKFNLKEIGWALPVIYTLASVGSLAGGWISGFLMRRGWPNGKARKLTLLICALCMPVAAMAAIARSPYLAIALVSLATAAHQGWSANLFTTTSDVFPKRAVASVTGIGGCLGGFGGVIFTGLLPGYVVSHFGYTPVFLIMGSLHMIAIVAVHLLLRDMRRLNL
jgi:ACS family hexuronate transporter-like MFS transporter